MLEPADAGGLRELCGDQESADILARDVSCTHRATDDIGGITEMAFMDGAPKHEFPFQ